MICVAAVADDGDVSSGVIKSKAVSCPLVLKDWSSLESGEHDRPSQSVEDGKN